MRTKRLGVLAVAVALALNVMPISSFAGEANAVTKTTTVDQTTQGKLYNKQGDIIYNGGLKNGKPNGYGVGYGYDNEVVYVGSFKDGKYDGYGKCYLDGELSFAGQYKNNQRIFGAYLYRGYLDYIGEFVNNFPNNWGIHFQFGTFEYECVAQDNGGRFMILTKDIKKIGTLPISLTTLKFYDFGGEFKSQKEGYTVNEDKLKSLVKDYVANPQKAIDSLSNPNSLKYVGEFKNDGDAKIREGYGKLYNKDNELIYVGAWKNNNFEGYGVTFFDGVASYCGEFKGGFHEGLGYSLTGGGIRYWYYQVANGKRRLNSVDGEEFKDAEFNLPFFNLKINKTIDNLDESKLKDIIKDYDRLSKKWNDYYLKFIEKEKKKNYTTA